jgi:hypothetical protein
MAYAVDGFDGLDPAEQDRLVWERVKQIREKAGNLRAPTVNAAQGGLGLKNNDLPLGLRPASPQETGIRVIDKKTGQEYLR